MWTTVGLGTRSPVVGSLCALFQTLVFLLVKWD